MPRPGSSRAKSKDKESDIENEDSDEASENHINSERGINTSPSPKNDSPNLNVSIRSDLHYHMDSSSSSTPEPYKRRYPNLNESSSISESPGGTTPRSKSGSPSNIYPLLPSNLKITGESASTNNNCKKVVIAESAADNNKIHAFIRDNNIIYLLILSVLLIAAYFYLKTSPELQEDKIVPPFDRFVGHVKRLEESFPKQNRRLWTIFKSSTKHVLQDKDSIYPAVILMAATYDCAHISRCIANKIASEFDSINKNSLIIDINDLQHLDPAIQKRKLDQQLNSAFSSAQRKSVVIDNLQMLHPEAALMLHSYCDGDNAPYKDVMIMLLLHADKGDVPGYTESAFEGYLEQLWIKGLDVDKVKALLSRVANNVVTVEAEDELSFQAACQ